MDTGRAGAGHLVDSDASVPGGALAEALLDAIAAPVAVLDSRGHIRFLNAATKALVGATADQLAGQPAGALLEAPGDAEDLRESLVNAPGGVSRPLTTADGRQLVLNWRGLSSCLADGEPVLVCVASEVSARFAVEQSLIQAQKMESLGTLAGGVAHDFNNLLAAILGFVGLLKMNDDLDEESAEQLGNIEQAARRGADIAGRLLAFSRGGVTRFARLDLRELVEETARLAGPALGRRVSVELELGGEPAVVEGDFSQLQQAILNVILNARDAMKDGGRLAVTLERVSGEAVLRLRDSGPGVPEAVRTRIFEPFFTTKEPGSGTGLGLAITYGIARSHGGSVRLEPSEGGACFAVALPLAAEPEEVAIPDADSAGGNLVLVVDDDDLARKSLSATLARLGYNVVEVATGPLAVDLVRARPGRFSAVLLDMVMPGMNGREVFHALQRVRQGLPVVLCTGYAPEAFLDEAMRQGLAAVLQKPYSASELVAALIRVGAQPARAARQAAAGS